MDEERQEYLQTGITFLELKFFSESVHIDLCD